MDDSEDAPMFFTRPAQLPDIFTALGEASSSCRTDREEVWRAQNKQMETVSRLDGETERCARGWTTSRSKSPPAPGRRRSERATIGGGRGRRRRREEEPAERGRVRRNRGGDASAKKAPGARGVGGGGAGGEAKIRSPLEGRFPGVRVLRVRPDPSMTTIQMLTQIEMKLERCLAIADDMPAEYVRESEKAREKARRLEQRVKKAEADRVEAEEKAARSLERSMAPAKKPIGKPMMTRSLPPSRKKKVVKEVIDPEEEELRSSSRPSFEKARPMDFFLPTTTSWPGFRSRRPTRARAFAPCAPPRARPAGAWPPAGAPQKRASSRARAPPRPTRLRLLRRASKKSRPSGTPEPRPRGPVERALTDGKHVLVAFDGDGALFRTLAGPDLPALRLEPVVI